MCIRDRSKPGRIACQAAYSHHHGRMGEIPNQVLTLDSRELLESAGKISKKIADQAAKEELEKYRIIQDREYQSDFDKFAAKALEAGDYDGETR